MKTLVTGAAGFSGRRMVAALAAERVEVIAVARARCDLAERDAVFALLAAERPDRIYHLAGSFSDDENVARRDNVVASANLIAARDALGLECRLLLVGSAAEYGPDARSKVREDHPLCPVGVYARSKVMQTELMLGARRVVMARTFNLLGAGQSRRLLLGRVEAWLARREGRLETGDLSAERDYLPIDDAVAAYRVIMERGEDGAVYNVASGRARVVRAVVHELLREHGVDPAVVHETAVAAGVGSGARSIIADVSKLVRLMRR